LGHLVSKKRKGDSNRREGEKSWCCARPVGKGYLNADTHFYEIERTGGKVPLGPYSGKKKRGKSFRKEGK